MKTVIIDCSKKEDGSYASQDDVDALLNTINSVTKADFNEHLDTSAFMYIN
jgi:hypothetical protein